MTLPIFVTIRSYFTRVDDTAFGNRAVKFRVALTNLSRYWALLPARWWYGAVRFFKDPQSVVACFFYLLLLSRLVRVFFPQHLGIIEFKNSGFRYKFFLFYFSLTNREKLRLGLFEILTPTHKQNISKHWPEISELPEQELSRITYIVIHH